MDSSVTGGPGIAALIRSALDNYIDDDEKFDDGKWRRFLAGAEALCAHGSAAVTAVMDLFTSPDTRDRLVAAELLGRMPLNADQDMRGQCWSRLEAMLAAEQADRDRAAVIAEIAGALGHLGDVRALPSLLRLATHPCADVRFAVARSIPHPCSFAGRQDAVACLVTLTGDSDADVRDWSCFGLGLIDADGPEVREALAARLDDEHANTRCEALRSLARTGDPRAHDRLAERLGAGGEWKLEIEAAAELADPRLHPILRRLAEDWEEDDDYETFRAALEIAITRTDPRQPPAARATEARLRADLLQHLAPAGRTVRLEGEYPRTQLVVLDTDGHTELLNTRLWDDTEPLHFNYDQVRASCLLTAGAER